ncbi:MAG: RCC1 domain-containing protein [Polyangia bacterium]
MSCGPGVEQETTTDGGVDADTDTDTDADTDADTDTGTDTCPQEDYQVIDVGGGWYHTCAVLESGGLKCWGPNQFGGLGYGTDELIIGDDETPSSAGDVPVM